MKKLFPWILGACLAINCFTGASVAQAMNFTQVVSETVPPIQIASASDESEVFDPNITMSVRFDNKNLLRKTATPVHVTIENRGDAFEGEIKIRIVEVSYNSSNMPTAYDYVQTVEVPAQSKETFTIPLSNNIAQGQKIPISLYVNGEKRAQITKIARMSDNILIGLISKRAEDLNYWKKVTTTNSGRYGLAAFEYMDLTPDMIPRESYYLEGFSVLVMHHVEWSELDEIQQNKLIDWVYNGGVLIVDGDIANQGAIRSLKPLIELNIDGRNENVSQEEIMKQLAILSNNSYQSGLSNMGLMINNTLTTATISSEQATPSATTETASASSVTPITLSNISPKSEETLTVTDVPIIQTYPIGTGSVLVTTFDLAAPFLDEAGTDFILGAIVPQLNIDQQIQMGQMSSYINSQSLKEVIGNIEWKRLPSIGLVLFICTLFIILAGPIAYFTLKKFDKRDWIWGIAPGLALVFSGVFIVYGYQQHGPDPITSTISIMQNKGDGHYAMDSYIGIGVPKTGSYKIEFDADLLPSNYGNDAYINGYYGDLPETDPNAVKQVYEIGTSPRAFITMPHVAQWTMATTRVNYNTRLDGGLNCQIYTGEDEKIYYTITNETGYDLEDVTIIGLSDATRIEFLANGETKEGEVTGALPDQPSIYGGIGNPSDMINQIYNVSYIEKTLQQQREEQEKLSILFSISNQIFGYDYYGGMPMQQSIIAYGWTKNIKGLDTFVDGQLVDNVQNISLIIDNAEIELIRDGFLSIPAGYIQGMLVDPQSNLPANSASYIYFAPGENEKIVSFTIPEGNRFDITSLTFGAMDMNNLLTTELYNTQTNKWESYTIGRTLKDDQAQAYVDQSTAQVLIRFTNIVKDDIEENMEEGNINGEISVTDSAVYMGNEMFINGLSIRVSGKEKTNANAGN